MTSLSKPRHLFATLLGLFAAVYLVVDPALTLWTVWRAASADAQAYGATVTAQQALETYRTWTVVRDAVTGSLGLAAAAFAVGLLDEVRWRLTPEDERADLRGRYLLPKLMGWLRNPPGRMHL